MVDLWRLGSALFMLALLFVMVEVVSEYSVETGFVVFVIGFIGFILSLIGSFIHPKEERVGKAQ
ncbi:MAG: hypothetical protein J7K21_03795 [Desulfurococcales archaeon]|nr:hypothetical protein [Desulfurococcales archaeon]